MEEALNGRQTECWMMISSLYTTLYCLYFIYKVVYRLDIYLFYSLVYLKYNGVTLPKNLKSELIFKH